MTKADESTLKAFETGLYKYLDLMQEGINGKFDIVDKRFDKTNKKIDEHISEKSTKTVIGWGKVRVNCIYLSVIGGSISAPIVAVLAI